MKSEVKKLGKHQLEITITVPPSRVGEVLEKVTDDAAKEIEVEGFRKGHAPKNLVHEKVDKQKVYNEAISRIVSEAYSAVVKERLLKPVVSPQIELLQFEPEAQKDLIFKATTAERPEVTLGDYKTELAKLKVRKPADSIVGPDGKPLKSPNAQKSQNAPTGPTVGDALTAALSTCEVEVPKILVENEVNRMLSRLVDQTARLGLTVEQYLQSQGKTAEQLRAEYGKQAEETLKAELVLDEIAKAEKIEVTDKEIEEAVKANPDPQSQKEFAKEENKWYIKSILKRNKTLQRLLDLAK